MCAHALLKFAVQERFERERQRRQEREAHKVTMEEIAPKATGKDARMENKRAVNAVRRSNEDKV